MRFTLVRVYVTPYNTGNDFKDGWLRLAQLFRRKKKLSENEELTEQIRMIIINSMNQKTYEPLNTELPTTERSSSVLCPRLVSKHLFATSNEVIIEHAGEEYRLRLTRQGKLILTK